jgi:hypothetical protein
MPNRQTSKEDTMALRVPKSELPAELRESMIRQLGAVPEPAHGNTSPGYSGACEIPLAKRPEQPGVAATA